MTGGSPHDCSLLQAGACEVPATAASSPGPRTKTGKRASAAAAQRERDYLDWVAALPLPRRDDEERDESYETFMSQRRVIQDRERWKTRRLKQWQERGRLAPTATPQEAVERDFKEWRSRVRDQYAQWEWRPTRERFMK